MRDYKDIQKDLIKHQNIVDGLIKEMEDVGYGVDFAIDLGNNYVGCMPSRELGEERICAIYKGYYYTKDQCWNGDNDITIFNYGVYSIRDAIKEFFSDFGKMLEEDGDIDDGEKLQYEIDNYLDSCDAELLECFKKEIFKHHKNS